MDMIKTRLVVMEKKKSMFGKRANSVQEVWQEVRRDRFSA
jgi:hypothetical protein